MRVQDQARPFHGGALGVVRVYEAQRDYARVRYQQCHPNTDPVIGLFGNWGSSLQPEIRECWSHTRARVFVTTADESMMFEAAFPDFPGARFDASQAQRVLVARMEFPNARCVQSSGPFDLMTCCFAHGAAH